MTQLFSPVADLVMRLSLAGLVLLAGVAVGGGWLWWHSPAATGAGFVAAQPVPFSHQHHTTGLGIDCRYCHTGVETSSFAGLPPTHTCMTCHSQVWNDADILAPVRQSLAQNRPIRWQRVHNLPDFVFFDHHVHVANGVGCTSCHGDVGSMPLMMKTKSLYMEWCLDCHRNPAPNLRPRDKVFDLQWRPGDPGDDASLLARYGIDNGFRLSQCSVCHR